MTHPIKYGLSHLGIFSAIGANPQTTADNLFSGNASFMSEFRLRTTGTLVPRAVAIAEPQALPQHLTPYDCRNHRLGYAAFQQIEPQVIELRERLGPHRIGVVLGSSTAGLDATEQAFEQWQQTGSLPEIYDFKRQHAMGSVSEVIAKAAGVTGPAYTLSTACTSSAKAMISARDLLATGLCDAVITGGVDTLCDLTINGFAALGAVSERQCLPMSRNRTGLNIGEGAALFIITRDPAPVNLIGGGETCDAHHMTAPHPEGIGAEASMRAALRDANLNPADIDYLNLHGTATPQNDAMEAIAVDRVFTNIPCSSTKPFVGHTLGAAGAIEAAFLWLSLTNRSETGYPLPPHIWDQQPDPDLPRLNLVKIGERATRENAHFMSNSFAFGGNNCSLILEGSP